jgi:hypothetical protein
MAAASMTAPKGRIFDSSGFRVQVPAGSPRTGTDVVQLVRTHHDHRVWPSPDHSPIAIGPSARDISGTLRRGAPGAIGASATDLRSDAGAENRRLRRSRSRVTNRATMIHRPRLGTRPAGLIASSSRNRLARSERGDRLSRPHNDRRRGPRPVTAPPAPGLAQGPTSA